MGRLVWIYALCDENKRVRYVGQTVCPQMRLYAHLHDDSGSMKSKWIADCALRGFEPAMLMLDRVPKAQARRSERRWIARFLKRYPDLCNVVFGTAPKVTPAHRIELKTRKDVEFEALCAEIDAAEKQMWIEEGCDENGNPVTEEAKALEREILDHMVAFGILTKEEAA